GDVGGFRVEVAERRQVANAAVGVAAADDDLLHGPRSGQVDRRRLYHQGHRLADDLGARGGIRRHRSRSRGGQQQSEGKDQTAAADRDSSRTRWLAYRTQHGGMAPLRIVELGGGSFAVGQNGWARGSASSTRLV